MPVSVPNLRDLYWYRCCGAGSAVSRDSPRHCWAPEQSDAVSPRGLCAHRYRTVLFSGTLETALWEARGCLCPPPSSEKPPAWRDFCRPEALLLTEPPEILLKPGWDVGTCS